MARWYKHALFIFCSNYNAPFHTRVLISTCHTHPFFTHIYLCIFVEYSMLLCACVYYYLQKLHCVCSYAPFHTRVLISTCHTHTQFVYIFVYFCEMFHCVIACNIIVSNYTVYHVLLCTISYTCINQYMPHAHRICTHVYVFLRSVPLHDCTFKFSTTVFIHICKCNIYSVFVTLYILCTIW